MQFLRQTCILIKKDLIILVRRHAISTAIRALVIPIVLTTILAYIRVWTETPGIYGVGSPSPVKSLSDALAETGSTRPKVVFINSGFTDGDIGAVVSQLSDVVKASSKELHLLEDASQLSNLCPSSNGGVSDCFGALQFFASPDHGGGNWNYTLYADASIGNSISVVSTSNEIQLYALPLKQAVDSAIASTHGGNGLPSNIQQFPFTYCTESREEKQDAEEWQGIIRFAVAFAFFIALSGIVYHLTGYIAHQREQGMLQLVDAMMPNKRRWECLAVRILSAHLAFDLVYLPGWTAAGGILALAFPNSNAGYFILANILGGLALSSYSILASSLFRRAQLSAICAEIAALVFALVAQFAFIVANAPPTGGIIATSILFPPSAYVLFLLAAAGFEYEGQGLQLSQPAPITLSSNRTNDGVTAGMFLGLFVFQIFAYPLIGALIERTLHGTWSSQRNLRGSDDMSGAAVRLNNFSKHYKNLKDKKKTVKAVDDLSLNLHAGSITVLLGANGSGKSTTLNAIAGLETITSGTIELDGTGGLGLCPQKNIMWEELTVAEHIEIFEALKHTRSGSQTKTQRLQEVSKLIEACDLEVKSSAQVKTLSGGQKRRTQLAMMLAGGSRVCCIDEASSGIDPIARRKVWDILLTERGQRTIFFTTHFLDEAEVLSDHVAILSKGKLKAEGTVASLKNQQGGGYRVILEEDPVRFQLPTVPNTTIYKDYGRFVLTVSDQSSLGPLVTALEHSGVNNYRIQGPTIEDVFLELVDEMRGESEQAKELLPPGSLQDDSAALLRSPATVTQNLQLETGRGCSPLQQIGVLFYKRLIVLKHNYMPYICALFVSLVVSGMVTRFFIGFQFPDGVPCADPSSSSRASFTTYLTTELLSYSGFAFGPASVNDTLPKLIPNFTSPHSYPRPLNWGRIPILDSLDALNNYVSNNSTRIQFGAFFDDQASPTFAWEGRGYGSSPVFVQGALNSVLMNQTISFGFQTFRASFTPSDGDGTIVAVFTALGFAIYPGLFALYPTAERLRRVRAMQYSNGILASSLWLAHSFFDLVFILLISVLTVVIWATQYHGWYGLGYMFVVFFLYGLASTALSYVVSLFVSSQLAAFAYTAVIQVIVSMLYFVGYIISTVNAPATQVYDWFNYIHYTVGLISPASNLLRGLFMSVNSYSLVCRGSTPSSYPGEIGIYGAPILYLLVQFLSLAAFLMFWESGRSLEVFGIRRKQKTSEEYEEGKTPVEFDAAEDPSRVSSSNNGLRLLDVSKSFGANLAVDNVTFGILPSEKFALLGPNGAGKSTVISLIRGDLAGRGSVFIGGDSLQQAPVAAKNHLGVCPQFDAQDAMTVTEHLRFYARARGVSNREANISELMGRLGLDEHRNKLAMKLSGGTQRKLSLAIALISNPAILLLDEPSSGMDPAAKRALWATLSAISAGRVLLLTTHSMEEADALCDRAGIMAGKLLALGSVEELRSRHGNAAYVHLVHRDAPYTSDGDMIRMRGWVQQQFPDGDVEQRVFGGQLRFSVPNSANTALGRLFKIVEEAKEELGVKDYSIGPGTLDQVFLNVVGRHHVQEENIEVEKEKGRKKSWFGKLRRS